MRNSFLSVVLFLMMSMSISFASYGQCTVHQNEIDTYLYTQDDFGQSFLTCEAGQLMELDIPVHHFLDGEIMGLLSIYSGDGYDGELLYTDSVVLSDEWGGYIYHFLHTAIDVEANSMYTFRVDFFNDYGVSWANFTNAHENGQFYWNGQAHGTVDMGFMAHIENVDETCISWTGSVNEDWNESLNWNPPVVPDSNDCVIVPSGISGFYPVIEGAARAGNLVISEAALLNLQEGSRLHVFGNLDAFGEAQFQGEVIMEEGAFPGEINGSPIFNKLKIKGLFYTTEPIEILNHLDLRDGYLANFGTELYLNVGDGYHGHAYIPEDIIVGNVIIKRHTGGQGAQLVGLPFTETCHEEVMNANDIPELLSFRDEHGFEQFDNNWQSSLSTQTAFGVKNAVLLESEIEIVELEGQTSNENQIILGSQTVPNEAGKIQLVGNPYPSVINWDKVTRSEGAPKASYLWIPEKQQFGSRVDNIQTNDMGNLLHPTDAILIELEEGDEINIDYVEAALEPWQLYADELTADPDAYSIRLGVTGPSGADETLILLNNQSSSERDIHLDALKIPSLNDGVPTIASRTSENDFLSINSIPFPQLGARVELYVDPGTEGTFMFTPLLLDLGLDYNSIYLVDSKYHVYHDLLNYGAYQTEVLTDDDRGRFSIQFDTYKPDPSIDSPFSELSVEEAIDATVNEIDPEEITLELVQGFWDVIATEGAISIRPEVELIIPSRTQVTIYSAEGKQVLDRIVSSDTSHLLYDLHVSRGMYLVKVYSAGRTQVQKVWMD